MQLANITESNPPVAEPAMIIAGKKNNDGNIELRVDSVARAKPQPDSTPGPVDIKKTKAKGKAMINHDTGAFCKTMEISGIVADKRLI